MKIIKTPFLALLLAACTAQAATLVEYTMHFSHVDATGKTVTPALTDAGVVSSSITSNAINTLNYSSNTIAVTPQIATPIGTPPADLISNVLANGTYISFSISPEDTATAFALTNLSINAKTGGTSQNRTFYVFSSVTGFSVNNLLFSATQIAGDPDASTLSTTAQDYIIPLTDPKFQGIAASADAPIEFRIYVQSSSIAGSINFGNIALDGAVIPESSTVAALTGFAALVFAVYQRRRR